MSITIELPRDVEESARQIPDLEKRLADFIRGQVDLDRWRERRYSPAARALAADALTEAERLRAQGVTREEAFRQLRRAHEKITRQL